MKNINEFTLLKRNFKDITSKSINIISNKIDIKKGDFNAELIRFDIGLNKYKVGPGNNNYLKKNLKKDDYSRLSIHKGAGINSQFLLIKSAGGDVNNEGEINTRTLVSETDIFINEGILDINHYSNIYEPRYNSKNLSFIKQMTIGVMKTLN
ncbi:hypothetical protein [Proteus hauseri]|uniref:hypothetical protein n=1 Tax=Proteus hauseri TaxID=183417 RepID=UPI00100BACA1|nr:hypothetical protein [Proteus hauseri]